MTLRAAHSLLCTDSLRCTWHGNGPFMNVVLVQRPKETAIGILAIVGKLVRIRLVIAIHGLSHLWERSDTHFRELPDMRLLLRSQKKGQDFKQIAWKNHYGENRGRVFCNVEGHEYWNTFWAQQTAAILCGHTSPLLSWETIVTLSEKFTSTSIGKDDSALICQLVDVRGPTTVLGNPEEQRAVDVGAVKPIVWGFSWVHPPQPTHSPETRQEHAWCIQGQPGSRRRERRNFLAFYWRVTSSILVTCEDEERKANIFLRFWDLKSCWDIAPKKLSNIPHG